MFAPTIEALAGTAMSLMLRDVRLGLDRMDPQCWIPEPGLQWLFGSVTLAFHYIECSLGCLGGGC